MIVTAFPRAAGTIHCMRLAEDLGLRFADETFENDTHKLKRQDKRRKIVHHEAYDAPQKLMPSKLEVLAHPDRYVVLNHLATPELLSRTELFIVRQDLNQILESWFSLFDQMGRNRVDSKREFMNVAARNITTICQYLLDNPRANVLKAETMYQFTPRESQLKFKLLAQPIVDRVYERFT